MRIDSQYRVLGSLGPEFGPAAVKNEPMLFNCDLEAARQCGGIITQSVLAILPTEWTDVPLVIDSRVHMLMPGWYPCIPGWHHDDVPRTRSDGQPNYAEGQDRSEHLFLLVNGNICPTALATGERSFVEPPLGQTIYGKWHDEVEEAVASGELTKHFAPSNCLIWMNDRTWHACTPAVANGWRFFIRISRYFDANGKPIARRNDRTNEVRRQVQVYLDNPNAGW